MQVGYTTYMSFFVHVTPATKPKTDNVRWIAMLLAGMFVVMAVAQLFTFEDFPGLVTGFLLPTGDRLAPVVAALIVLGEVVSVPFLLGMSLSPLARWCGMVSGWLVVGAWFVISIWLNVTASAATTAGFLGVTVKLPIGWWAVCFSLALGVLAGWASWGMWPGPIRKK